MKYVTLGRTGLNVSIAGLGCGGHSRLGTAYGKTEAEAADLIRLALDHGVNLIDTATNYRTEPVVARALADRRREDVIVSSKASPKEDGKRLTGPAFLARLEASLDRLDTDYVDLYHVHGVSPDDYPHVAEIIVPVLLEARDKGKVRHLAISEAFGSDPAHHMLQRALRDDHFDVVMVGHNLLNPSARRSVLPATQQHQVGTLCMFAVRRALTQPDRLREVVDDLIESGELQRDDLDRDDPLGFLGDVTDAGYRFCAHEPGLDVVLFGTGNPEHLKTNLESINAEPLPAEQLQRLESLFGQVESVSGN